MKVNGPKFPVLLQTFPIPASQHHWRNTIYSLLGTQPCERAQPGSERCSSQPPTSSFLLALKVRSTFRGHRQLLQQLLTSTGLSAPKLVGCFEAFFRLITHSPPLAWRSLILQTEMCHQRYYSDKKWNAFTAKCTLTRSSVIWTQKCEDNLPDF